MQFSFGEAARSPPQTVTRADHPSQQRRGKFRRGNEEASLQAKCILANQFSFFAGFTRLASGDFSCVRL
jgi:hypothetical protein